MHALMLSPSGAQTASAGLRGEIESLIKSTIRSHSHLLTHTRASCLIHLRCTQTYRSTTHLSCVMLAFHTIASPHVTAMIRVFYAMNVRCAPHFTFNPGLAHVINLPTEAGEPPVTYGTMHAADPTYPLYPIACFMAFAMLLLVLLTSFVRQRWNFGVASLCFWLLLELLSLAINSIIWSDNADIKLYVYCDIGWYNFICANVSIRSTLFNRAC